MKYNYMKVMPYEKQIIKGMVAMLIAKGENWKASDLEYEIMRITGNNNGDHRQVVEDYIINTYGATVGYEF